MSEAAPQENSGLEAEPRIRRGDAVAGVVGTNSYRLEFAVLLARVGLLHRTGLRRRGDGISSRKIVDLSIANTSSDFLYS